MALLREQLATSIRRAADFDSGLQVSPICILWPDGERQWEAAIGLLQDELPELLLLGDYDPRRRSGPAIWLRCAIERKTDDLSLPEERTPILYLPGYSRQQLRAVESCPEALVPLAELQYRGTFWSQTNGKDWTVTAFLSSTRGGLGLDVADDPESRRAAQLALYRLLDQEISLLSGKRLDRDAFGSLLTGGDTVRDVLLWLDNPDTFRKGRSTAEWRAFCDACRSKLGFEPDEAGVLDGAERLARHTGAWASVWERYREAPNRYGAIPARIRQCAMPPADTSSNGASHGGWPQWNDSREVDLRSDLLRLATVPEHVARERLITLEKNHSDRRGLVWADIGEAPLARALEHLARLPEMTRAKLASGSLEELAAGYAASGWQADAAVIGALSCVDDPHDVDAVTAAVRAVYLPWIDESARHLQKSLHSKPIALSRDSSASFRPLPYAEGECLVFTDGLRFDVGVRLEELLRDKGCSTSSHPVWAALPTITATAKPAVSPVRSKYTGGDATLDFEPFADETGHPVKGSYVLKKLLTEAKWSHLAADDTGDGKGHAWTEMGNIDHEGHEHGCRLSRQLDGMLHEVRHRVLALLGSGWKRVRIVTDHGWLLMPGGLPKSDLPVELADHKWGRCALLKAGAETKERLYPWFWNPSCQVAVPDGVHCFRQGYEYAHGGVSLQECLTSEIFVTLADDGSVETAALHGILWKGLRLSAVVSGSTTGLSLDVRAHAGNAKSSLIKKPVPVSEDGTVSVLVENDDQEGKAAVVVLLDAQGSLVAQQTTVVGGSKP